ncbi:DUF4280 domain-containing protein [Cupriavidus taiwanensis]|uniref:DUF4280 domain-containing protein n=1 Tax=Cupriavidus taiwanensis TaxID=164546 RepID=UPI00253FE8D2|nr:DUF4280 domain-containing protein [Cupriavidus taiwanensis]MDK3022013.1 DUF4280 domain-containing protein [Cupriavidus taiwanensis]
MALQVTAGAAMQCSFGLAPSTLAVLPLGRVLAGTGAASVMDHLPLVNIPPFGLCQCVANPQVAAATAAAQGVLTPMPCVPVTPAPWLPGAPTVQIGGAPALQHTSRLACAWGGVIRVVAPAQATVMTP